MRHKLISVALVASVAAAGCLPVDKEAELKPLDGTSTSALANKLVGEHLDGVANVVKVLDRSKTLAPAAQTDDGNDGCPPPKPGLPPPACNDPEESSRFDLTEYTDGLKSWLQDNVFNVAAIESTTETSITYRLTPEVACPEETDDTGAIARDEDCVKFFTEMPVRLVVTSTTEGDLDIAVNVAEHKPASVELYAAHLSGKLDLAAAKAVITDAAALLGEDAPNLPERLSGVFELALVKNGQDDYTFALGVLEALNIGLKETTSNEYVDIKLGVAPEAARVRLSAESGVVDAAVAIGTVNVAVALEQFAGEPEEECVWNEETEQEDCTTETREPLEGIIGLALKGLTGAGTFNVDTDTLSLTGLGLGNDKGVVTFNDAQALSVAVNSDTNGLFDLALASLEDGWKATIVEQLNVTIEHSLGALADALGEDGSDVPAWAKSGETSVAAAGNPDFVLRFLQAPEPPCDGETGECDDAESSKYKVEQGTLTLSSTDVTPVTITAPECIIVADEEEGEEGGESAHPFTLVSGGSCE